MQFRNRSLTSKLITSLIVIIFITSNVLAGTKGKIAGIVTDQETGEPLPGANVMLENTTKGASTDADGYFYILNVQPGTYSLKTSVIGYEIMTVSDIGILADRTTNVNFELKTAVLEGEEVIVTADRAIVELDVTGSQNVMDIGYFERAPISDISDALSQQTGVQNTGATTFLRGGLATEINYILDGTSLNSGIISDNYQKMNVTAIQEISVLTGGYNAEYGQAMSGIVNVITREASTTQRGIHGSFSYKTRPAGKYHWGKNMYSNDLLRTSEYNLDYWTGRVGSSPTWFSDYFQTYYGEGTPTNNSQWDGIKVPTPEVILTTFQEQMTPNSILGDYTKRSQQEFEGTVYGSFMNNMSFLVSGRYLRGVNIYPQSQEYNPEYNIQTKLDYHFSPDKKLSLNVLTGWYKTSSYSESNWNNMETSQEARWQPNGEVHNPYWEDYAFGPWGGVWGKGPQEKNFFMSNLSWHHTLSPRTFYEIKGSYISDLMTEYQDFSEVPQPLEVVPWGSSWYDLAGRYRLAARYVSLGNRSESNIISLKGDLVSQVHKAHQMKTGAELKLYNLDYDHYWFEFQGTDIWHLDNVWDGKPVDVSAYIQDKIEYPGSGFIANIGLRIDAFNTNKDYPSSIFDPLGIQPWNGGDGVRPSNLSDFWPANQLPIDWFHKEGATEDDYRDMFPDSALVNGNTVASEWKMALAPRIGISFPVTATSKLRFNYGHFYQRPSWTKLMGFPISWQENDPYNTARMDQWMGWCGNPGLGYEKTIQYEIGFTKSIMRNYRLDLAGYYKDASELTQFGFAGNYSLNGGLSNSGWEWESPETFSIVHSSAASDNNNVFYTNNAYRDMRGIEATIESIFNGVWSAKVIVNYGLVTGGVNGYSQYDEDTTMIHQPHTFSEEKGDWLSSLAMKGELSYVTPKGFGPAGLLGDISMAFYYEWFQGPEYTYYPDDYTGLQRPNNKRWRPHRKGDLKLFKKFDIGGFSPIVGLEVYNLFNDYDLTMLGGNDLKEWEENDRAPQAGVISGGATEDDIWFFYNSWSNPMRMIFLTVSLEI